MATYPEIPQDIRDAWDYLSDARSHVATAGHLVELVERSLSDEWFREMSYRNRLVATERFLMNEGYRRIDLDGNWTKEPIGEAS